MGFFSEIANEARRGMAHSQALAPTRQTAVQPVTAPEMSSAVPEILPDLSAPVPEIGQEPSAAPEPPGQPAIDLTPATETADETDRRRAHEAAETRRRAEFDARQAEKRAKRQAELDRIAAMDDEDAVTSAVERIGMDTERLTRRNMKIAVCEYVQDQCRRNQAFARLALRPEKTMARCFQYINRQAREYAEQEMKDNRVERTGTYCLALPDECVYQMAERYFQDPDAKEDHEGEERFMPKPYVPPARTTSKTKSAKSKPERKKPSAEKPKAAASALEQMSLM